MNFVMWFNEWNSLILTKKIYVSGQVATLIWVFGEKDFGIICYNKNSSTICYGENIVKGSVCYKKNNCGMLRLKYIC